MDEMQALSDCMDDFRMDAMQDSASSLFADETDFGTDYYSPYD